MQTYMPETVRPRRCVTKRPHCLVLKFAEVIDTLLYGRVTSTLRAERIARLETAYQQVLLRVIEFQRGHRTAGTTLSYAKVPKITRCESIQATSRIRRFFVLAVTP